MAYNEILRTNSYGNVHSPYDDVPEDRILVIPPGFESWFQPTTVVAPEPVVAPLYEPSDPWAAWAAGITELLKSLAPVGVGILAIWLLASLGEK